MLKSTSIAPLPTPPFKIRGASTLQLLSLFVLTAVTSFGQATYTPDCNDPDSGDRGCLHPKPEIVSAAQAAGYPYYIGHAEPTTLFFSNAPASGNNMQWKFKLPTAPSAAPTQSGSIVDNFELYIAHWVGLALCDPNSKPYGGCVASSDTNNPATAGSAFLELQFYAPGLKISNTQWSVNLHINTLQDKTIFQMNNCLEPTTAVYVTTNGAPAGTKMLMNNGDTIIVTLRDTPNGLRADVNDVTTGTTGFMVASGANGFLHNANQTDCSTTAFDFHPMFATAAPGNVVPWASLGPNVSFDFEIGHWQLCGDVPCTMKPPPPNNTNCQTVRGVGGCFDSDTNHLGLSYQADWPDGTAAHPGTVVLGSPDDKGVGPLSAPTSSSSTYNLGYNTIKFMTTEATTGAFYPFWSQVGSGVACVFNFGNDNAGETNNFGKAAQYGTTIANPCLPGAAAIAPTFTKQFAPTQIAMGSTTVLTFTISNLDTTTLTGITFNDVLPAGLSVASFITGCTGVTTAAGSSISLTGATLAAGANCTIVVNVTGTAPGVKNNITSGLTSNESPTAPAATSTVAVVGPPSISKAFATPAFPINSNSPLTFKLTNNNGLALTGVSFTDTLPAGLVIATPNGIFNSCGLAALTATAGTTAINLTGATLPANTICTISVLVTGTAPGIKLNNTSIITSNEGGNGAAAAAQTIVALPATMTKAFGVAVIPLNGVTTLTFNITNPNSFVGLTQLSFNDPLPAGLAVANPPNILTTCGGTVTALAGTNSISLANGALAASATCTVTVNVTGVAPGDLTNIVGAFTSLEGGPGILPSAKITVGGNFLISYAANLTTGDSIVNMTNTGANGANLLGPGFGTAAGNICVNVYAFSPDEQLVSCCSCLITPNGLASLSVNQDLVSNTLTGVRPNSVVVKLLPTGAGANFGGTSCTNSAAVAGNTVNPLIISGGLAFGTTVHILGAGSAVTENPFRQATLSQQELNSITNRCTNIIGNGSSFGICKSCRAGGLHGTN